MNLTIKEAHDDEIGIVQRLVYEAFKQYEGILHPPSGALTESVDSIRKKIEGRGGAIIAWKGIIPIGAALYFFEENYVYIGRVSVLPSYRGKGTGKHMILYLENLARKKKYNEARVEVRLSLPENIAFYQNMNYEVIETQEYPEGTDRWHTMSKKL